MMLSHAVEARNSNATVRRFHICTWAFRSAWIAWWTVGCLTAAWAETFYVSPTGSDAPDRDGRTPETAWRTLAFACEQVPAGDHTIQLLPGEFPSERPACPRNGIRIEGPSLRDASAARLIASPSWPRVPQVRDLGPTNEFLIVLHGVSNVVVRNLELSSSPHAPIAGGIYARDVRDVRLEGLRLRNFRWNAIGIEYSRGVVISNCDIFDGSLERHQYHGGSIRTRWIHDSALVGNRIVSTNGSYGYKGSGHQAVRVIGNHIEVGGEFSIESAHENEYGLEIAWNYLNRCISVSKGGQGDDPNRRGFPFSVWIHHNLMTDSYAVEGPRNHLVLSENYIVCSKPNGRIYTHHGGVNHGPVRIYRNIIEQADRGFIWMNQGLAERIEATHNIVVFADAGDRAGYVVDAWAAERLNGWVIRNNVFVAPASQPRRFMPLQRGVPQKIHATHNVGVNILDLPEGNFELNEPPFRAEGERPWPWYAPATVESPLVDHGIPVGLPFEGQAPDIGAIEWPGQPWNIGPDKIPKDPVPFPFPIPSKP